MTIEARNTTDLAQIQDVIDHWMFALQNKYPASVAAQQTPDFVYYSLAPPLIADTSNTDDLQDWFATWKGQIGYELNDTAIAASGNLAICHGLANLTGERIDGFRVDLWFRVTLGLTKSEGTWKIFHEHNSVPFYMDGSLRAAVDLKP
jgi:PhnB protein